MSIPSSRYGEVYVTVLLLSETFTDVFNMNKNCCLSDVYFVESHPIQITSNDVIISPSAGVIEVFFERLYYLT